MVMKKKGRKLTGINKNPIIYIFFVNRHTKTKNINMYLWI